MAYAVYITCIFCVYTNNVSKLNIEILHAGQGRGTSLAPQTLSSKRLDVDDIHLMISFHIHNTYPLTYSY